MKPSVKEDPAATEVVVTVVCPRVDARVQRIMVAACVMFTLFMTIGTMTAIAFIGPQYGLVMTLSLLLAAVAFALLLPLRRHAPIGADRGVAAHDRNPLSCIVAHGTAERTAARAADAFAVRRQVIGSTRMNLTIRIAFKTVHLPRSSA